MKFSVLISLYNKEKTSSLFECLHSIQSQSYQASEIVIVFDGKISKELKDIVFSFTNLPIKVVELSKNIGLGKALNEGLKHCSYEWVFRMDTDDICILERFEKQVNYIKKNPGVVLFGGQIEEFDEITLEPIGIRYVPCTNNEIRDLIHKKNTFNHMTVAYKKTIVQAAGGYQHHLFMEDYNLWLRIVSQYYEVGNLPDILVKARAGSGMCTRRRGIRYIKSEWKLMNLKRKLNIQKTIPAFIYFVLRSFPRILPSFLIKFIYIFLRKKIYTS
ncbi:glycosyltransferase [Glaesserella parasuis]|uniref:glycosyltransferase n=1 Tax=Glaesserella parasuis TaxID=738 RepID=UPI0024369967|nr:glycosyltransferase [Glaesserella parasuis]MDG6460677.1 glycosyltransferase [Glaesserella parasuis]MDG6468245.1 glycosyltransferase [Glaesserella parasuis]MDG6482259.1 glycosyltransferase [Glaesserella parasuis]MDG6869684.1 glycosyltransferase [Glaesserella parasuis]MDO9732875.1 glycosyltransferase [Glaesserella parasuis]